MSDLSGKMQSNDHGRWQEVNSAVHVTLLTGRTIEQGVGKEQGKASKEYQESVSVCYMDPADMKKLGIKDGTSVLVSTTYGSIVVKAAKSLRAPHPGIVYIPYGPWANAIVNPETHGIGMPSFKGIPAEVEVALDKPVLTMSELLKQQYGRA